MAAENPVYFKIGYEESLESEKNILYLQMSLLNLPKIIKRYNAWRSGELEIKAKLCKSVKELDLIMRKTKSSLPYLKIPEKKEEESEKEINLLKKYEGVDEGLKLQLQDIQNKLNSLNQ